MRIGDVENEPTFLREDCGSEGGLALEPCEEHIQMAVRTEKVLSQIAHRGIVRRQKRDESPYDLRS